MLKVGWERWEFPAETGRQAVQGLQSSRRGERRRERNTRAGRGAPRCGASGKARLSNAKLGHCPRHCSAPRSECQGGREHFGEFVLKGGDRVWRRAGLVHSLSRAGSRGERGAAAGPAPGWGWGVPIQETLRPASPRRDGGGRAWDPTPPPHPAPRGAPGARDSAVPRTHQQALHVDGVSAPAAHRLLGRVHQLAGQPARRPLLTHAAPRPRPPRVSRLLRGGPPAAPTRRPRSRAGAAPRAVPRRAGPGRGRTRTAHGRGVTTRVGGEQGHPRLPGRPAAISPHAQCAAPSAQARRRRNAPRANPLPEAGARENPAAGSRRGWRGQRKRWSWDPGEGNRAGDGG